MGIVSKLYECVALISPRVEVTLRKLYWRNADKLKKFNPNKVVTKKELKEAPKVDFLEIEDYLRSQGIGDGSLLIVHSSYDQLEGTGLSPEEIVDRLLKLIGPTGTLAMPAIRKYKGEPEGYDCLKVSTDDMVFTYKPRKTMIKTGWLPLAMVQRKDSVVSRHPLNPMVAIGPLAEAMMEHNLDGVHPSPHGPNSSWKFCYDHGAKVIGLGVNLYHYNTICHINEEAFGNWRIKDEEWYRLRKFHIIDGEFDETVTVRERKPEWGMLRLAELNSTQDLHSHNIVSHHIISGIDIYVEDSQVLIKHFQDNARKKKTFYI